MNHNRNSDLTMDKVFTDFKNSYRFQGMINEKIDFITAFQLERIELWERFVNQFKEHSDTDKGWRGEYWGKMMRGACFVYSITKSDRLYQILADTVKDLLTAAEDNGRISSYPIEMEFTGWDLWSRKYVLLGMQYFLEITDDHKLSEKIINSLKMQADYIISRIGPASEGKIPINTATKHWRGLNSSSILEPIVRLYNITKEKRYLDFAEYIVKEGGTSIANLFNLAYNDKLYPYQYPVTKAYEMMSCFEGLLEYYRVTKNEYCKTAVINFANKILESDFTIIGSCGCTHEYFDHSTVRQANTTNGDTGQETCVTVTLMKFMYQLACLTGERKYVDAFEISFYNAYLGAINTDKIIESSLLQNHPELKFEALPFDSYSPLTAGTRGNAIGGFKVMSDGHYYGCCACIGAAGLGLFAKTMLMYNREGFIFNLFTKGEITSQTPSGKDITFIVDTEYPKNGQVKINPICEAEEFVIKIRNPYWSSKTDIKINGVVCSSDGEYITISQIWKTDDEIIIDFDMRTRAIRPIPYGSQIIMTNVVWGQDVITPKYDEEDPKAKNHIALQRGPIILAQENRLGYNVDKPIEVKVNEDGFVNVIKPDKDIAPYEHIVEVKVPLKNGEEMTVTDYASAGKTFNEKSKMAAWMLTL